MLKGKIIKILDNKRVIVNLGYKEVKKDMRFIIYAEGEEIIDPESQISLGRREIVKHKIKADHIQENFSVMVSDVWVHPTINRLLGYTDATQKNLLTRIEVKKTDDSDLIIKIGDLVREDIS